MEYVFSTIFFLGLISLCKMYKANVNDVVNSNSTVNAGTEPIEPIAAKARMFDEYDVLQKMPYSQAKFDSEAVWEKRRVKLVNSSCNAAEQLGDEIDRLKLVS